MSAIASNPIEFVIGGMSYSLTPSFDSDGKIASYSVVFSNTMGKESLMLHDATNVGPYPLPLGDKKQTFNFDYSADEFEDIKNE